MKKGKETKGQCPLKMAWMQSMTPVYVSGKKIHNCCFNSFLVSQPHRACKSKAS